MPPEAPSPGAEERDRRTPVAPDGSPADPVSGFPPPIPDHELIRLIARGSYGEVWLARSALGTWRAVKIVHRHTFWHDHPFDREFKGIQKFEPISRSHEGLVDILQVGRGEGCFYYVMELADDANAERETRSAEPTPHPGCDHPLPIGWGEGRGEGRDIPRSELRVPSSYAPHTLSSELHARGRLPVADCIRIALTLTSALEHLHQHGLVHRDVKPSNVVFVGGVPKLADIGMVAEVSEARSYVGTEGFIPPEGPGTPQADLYSLGKLLYEISTGKDRHEFPTLPPNLDELADKQALIELNAILLKACDPDPRQRYANAAALRTDLELLQSGRSVRQKRTRQRRWALIRTAGVGAAMLATLALFGSLLFSTLRHRLRTVPAAPADRLSIFVLPFRHSAPSPLRREGHEIDQDVCLCGRLTDAFIDALPLIPGIQTGPRKSGWVRYDEDQVRRELVRTNDTRYILTGRVDHTNDALRLALRLYERRQEMPIWTETFAAMTNEVIALEQQAIAALARRLGLSIAEHSQRQVDRTLSNNLAAYGLLLQARSLYASAFRKDYQQTFEDYSSAVRLDPLYVAGHGGVMMLRGELSFEQSPKTAQPEIVNAAQRILKIDDTVFLAYNRIAFKHLYYDYDWAAAQAELERMARDWPEEDLELAIWFRTFGRTNESRLHHERLERKPLPNFFEAFFLVQGELVWRRHDKALAAAQRFNELYPQGINAPYLMGRVHLAAGRSAEAIEWLRKAAPEGPGSELQGLLGWAYALAGDRTNALAMLRQLEPRVRSGDADPYYLAWIYAGLGRKEDALDSLEKAVAYKSEYVVHADFGGLRTDPAWDDLRDHPRFEKLCESVGMGKGQWPR